MLRVHKPTRQDLLSMAARFTAASGALSLLYTAGDRWRARRCGNGRLHFPYIRRRQGPCFQILCYHRVNDEQDPFFPGIPVATFTAQMEMLRRHFHVLPLDELVDRFIEGDVPRRSIAVTFDDGYRDNYENAFPVLKRLGLPATIFLTTGVVGGTSALWHERIFTAFRETSCATVVIDGKPYSLNTIEEKNTALYVLVRKLRKCSPDERDNLLRQTEEQLGIEGKYPTPAMLNWQEVKEMAQSTISFGAHTVSHPILSRLPIPQVSDEIIVSKHHLEDVLRQKVRLFAYPNGQAQDFNNDIKRIVREAGFSAAVTTVSGLNCAHTDLFALHRGGIWDHDPLVSAVKLGLQRVLA